MYKVAKLSTKGDVKTIGKATVEDEQYDEDIEAGPGMPPDEEEGPDDEEGRFFGGGITRDTADVLDFMEEQDQDESVCLVDVHLSRVVQELKKVLET